MVVKIGFVKLGNIGVAPLLELALDERAEREDIDVRVFGSGAKLTPEQAEDLAEKLVAYKPDLAVIVSPNAALPGPKKVREKLHEAGIPAISVTDAPGKKAVKDIEEKGFGYIIVEGDAMIGARKEFLDPVEMLLFNAEIIKVLAITGVFNVLQDAFAQLIESLKQGAKPELPRIVVNSEVAVKAAGFQNPYAQVKAKAAYEILKKVAEMNVEGCFKVQERERYVPIVAAAHEALRAASLLADEAREIEKTLDTVLRKPHDKDGKVLVKRKLFEKPSAQ
ncbi:MAG: F420-dependent methylenetetrahydromethanopterin dehydrogenase [Candidatus Hecatellales archaeon]|nr:MAG: F420-dependent methylenetetrahydromethanopterin dehydrogenase [Candidatus Hecatellales archaeon]